MPPERGAEPLLETYMDGGRIVKPLPSLHEVRERFQRDFFALDDRYKVLKNAPRYPVRLSRELRRLQRQVERDVQAVEL